MSEDKIFDKTLRLPVFNGTDEDWPVWSEKFLVRARRRGYKNLLLGTEQVPRLKEIAKDEEMLKSIERRRELNELAYEEIVMAIDTSKKTGRVAFDHVRLAKTPDNPDGNCYDAWQRLCAKYAPRQAPV